VFLRAIEQSGLEQGNKMPNINYIATDGKDIKLISPLREKQWQYHNKRSKHFGKRIMERSVDEVNEQLLAKATVGLLVDLAEDAETGKLVGYCLTSINAERQGEIESLYLQPEYRNQHIGDKLMKRSLDWMDKQGVKRKILVVGAGNEGVTSFYRRYKFEVRSIIMEQLE
jgi:ribosomal protein S18 acetylase RimI-like enzyme